MRIRRSPLPLPHVIRIFLSTINSQLSTSSHPALGIDYGDARIGIAATDDFGILAHPVETIDQAKTEPVGRIAELVKLRGIRTLVVGLPVRMDGTEGTSAEKVRKFAEKIRALVPDVPLVFIDETLTTTTASAKLREAGKKAKQQKSIIDQAAAVEILNLWMGDEVF
ncbi:MAG: Holliday junction resolvase RuvX [Luteolibacter sp.]